MPARHISPQSFDNILSELGDDPAIPDPLGIRKPSAPKNVAPQIPQHGNPEPLFGTIEQLELFSQAKKLVPLIVLGILIILILAGGLFIYQSVQEDGISDLEELSRRISTLQKEIDSLRSDLTEEVDILYDDIDDLEVSIHSLLETKHDSKKLTKPILLNHEQEVRRWRYLGSSQIAGVQQALFHLGKSHALFAKDALVLGDWRLTQIEENAAALSHPQGKTIVLKAAKSE